MHNPELHTLPGVLSRILMQKTFQHILHNDSTVRKQEPISELRSYSEGHFNLLSGVDF